MNRFLFVLAALAMQGLSAGAQDIRPQGDWWFWPDYTFERDAKVHAGPYIPYPTSPVLPVQQALAPLLLYGQQATEHITGLRGAVLPSSVFTIEMWMVNHVNQPVGAAISTAVPNSPNTPQWVLGYYDRRFLFTPDAADSSQALLCQQKGRGWKDRWTYLAASYDGKAMRLYVNGELLGEKAVVQTANRATSLPLEMNAYLGNEPYMHWGDLVRNVRVFDRALPQDSLLRRFNALQQLVDDGQLITGPFQFTAGPYLQMMKQDRVSMVWETDRPAKAVIRYGEQVPLLQEKQLAMGSTQLQHEGKSHSHIRKVELEGLKPETTYFYELISVSAAGDSISSGVLSFRTAVREDSPFTFGIISDTEARPYISHRITSLLWDERPDFSLHTGDLTDGGEADEKYQWNYEYFTGVGAFIGRIPLFPVPGNGEGDVYWYKEYHDIPDNEAFYSFRYGNAEFFMLNSNEPEEMAPGGKQYCWLEEQLKKSTARWKFVAHHHALYSADDDDYGDSWRGKSTYGDLELQRIIPLYEKYKVDMVFYGHLHTYQRSFPLKEGKVDDKQGIVYIQTGGAGGNLEEFTPTHAWFSAKTYRGHHYCTVAISGNELNLKMYDLDGRLKDYLDISKTGETP